MPKVKAANGYKLAPPLPKGEVFEDILKQQWKLGPSIGRGGFGEIYSAQKIGTSSSSYPYVIKIEPHENGPLFVERKFYITNAKPENIEAFKKEKALKTFGMPAYIGSGTHEFKGEKYRFIVMEKFGTDLWKIFLENSRSLPAGTVFKIGIQILYVLEYIHSCGYVHADIKGANILLGAAKDTQNKQVYLVDFGLATRFSEDKEFKPNPKKAHNGTIEYLSRDAHQGVETRRGDLEILAYNMIQWLGCKLPWESNLKSPKPVQESKEKCMENIPKFIKTCFGNRTPPGPIVDFLNYLKSLDWNSKPDYEHVRKLLITGLESGDSLSKPLQFSASKKKTPVKRKNENKPNSSPKRKAAKPKIEESEDEKENNLDEDVEDLDEELIEAVKVPRRGRAPNKANYKNEDEDITEEKEKKIPSTGKGRNKVHGKEESKENVGDEELVEAVKASVRGRTRNIVNYNEDSDAKKKKIPKKKVTKAKKDVPKEIHVTGDNLEGYTDAMKEVVKRKQQKPKSKTTDIPVANHEDSMEGYTESMKEIALKKKLNSKKSKKTDKLAVASSSKGRTKNVKPTPVVNGDTSDTD